MDKGLLIVLSGPSGVGKGTIKSNLLSKFNNIVESISVTTRKPRDGEIEGSSYFFRNEDEFDKLVEDNCFLEYCGVFGKRYGTLKEFVNNNLNSGKDVLLEIDVQGGLKIKGAFRDAVLIMIVPPSLKDLVLRLTRRNTETKEEIEKRFNKSKDELMQFVSYDYVVENDNLNKACNDVVNIIESEKLRSYRKESKINTIINIKE